MFRTSSERSLALLALLASLASIGQPQPRRCTCSDTGLPRSADQIWDQDVAGLLGTGEASDFLGRRWREATTTVTARRPRDGCVRRERRPQQRRERRDQCRVRHPNWGSLPPATRCGTRTELDLDSAEDNDGWPRLSARGSPARTAAELHSSSEQSSAAFPSAAALARDAVVREV